VLVLELAVAVVAVVIVVVVAVQRTKDKVLRTILAFLPRGTLVWICKVKGATPFCLQYSCSESGLFRASRRIALAIPGSTTLAADGAIKNPSQIWGEEGGGGERGGLSYYVAIYELALLESRT